MDSIAEMNIESELTGRLQKKQHAHRKSTSPGSWGTLSWGSSQISAGSRLIPAGLKQIPASAVESLLLASTADESANEAAPSTMSSVEVKEVKVKDLHRSAAPA